MLAWAVTEGRDGRTTERAAAFAADSAFAADAVASGVAVQPDPAWPLS